MLSEAESINPPQSKLNYLITLNPLVPGSSQGSSRSQGQLGHLPATLHFGFQLRSKEEASLTNQATKRCSALNLQEWTPFWWVLIPTSVTPLFLNPPPMSRICVHWNSSNCYSRKQPQCFQTRPVSRLQCLGAGAYRAEILIQTWWLALAGLRLIWRG